MRKLWIPAILLATTLMGYGILSYAQVTADMTAWNAGEVSPLFYGRTDFSKYGNACKTLQNMVVTSLGPVVRRPGLKYIAEIKDSNDQARFISFEYSNTDTYLLEFGPRYMRVFRNGGQVLQDDNSVYEITTPFTPDEVNDLQWVQSADVMYLVDGNDPPYTLSRADHNDWTFTPLDYNDGPFQVENDTTTTIQVSAVTIGGVSVSAWATSTGYTLAKIVHNDYCLYKCTSVHTSAAATEPGTGADWPTKWKEVLIPDGAVLTLTASSDLFAATDVNSVWQLTHKRPAKTLSGSFTSATSSNSIACESDYTATTHGTWTGNIYLERSTDDGGTWNLVETRSSRDDDNMLRMASENESDALYRFRMSSYTSGTCQYDLTINDYEHRGSARITAHSDPCTLTAEAISTISSMAPTKLWNRPYWSDSEGWPRTIEFHEDRLYYGGCANWPQTIWASKVGDWPNMKAGPDDDDALIFLLPGQNPIEWLLSHDQLLIGSTGSTGVLRSQPESEPVTPSNVEYRRQSRFGSASIRALLAGDIVMYVERDLRTLRGFTYDFSRDAYISPDLTILSSHITKSGVVDMAYQAHPDSIIWCIRADGDAAVLVYEGDNEVAGWSRVVTDGDFESVAVVPSSEEDEVWFVVRRTIDGETRRYVEQLQNYDWGDEQVDCFFVDCGATWDGGEAVNISGITSADPGVVTVSTWPTLADGTNLGDGDQIKITGVKGMTDLNGSIYTISNPSVGSKTFELRNSADSADVNTADFTAYTSAGTVQRFEKTFTGLTYLEGETLSVLSDGGILADVKVASGSITVSQWTNKIQVGLPYTSVLETLPLYLKSQLGPLNMNSKKLTEIFVNFYQTAGAEYGFDADDLEAISFASVGDDPNDPVPLFDGPKRLATQVGWTDEVTIYIQQEYALPMTVRSITARVDIGD